MELKVTQNFRKELPINQLQFNPALHQMPNLTSLSH